MERIPHIAKPTPRQLERLAALAPDVVWDAGHEYGIALLERYLSFTLAEALREGRVVRVQGPRESVYALNTGLWDSSFSDVYCMAQVREAARDEWEIKAFCTVGRSRYGRLLSTVDEAALPSRASYAQRGAALVANLDAPIELDVPAIQNGLSLDGKNTVAEAGLRARDELSEPIEDAVRRALETAIRRARRLPLSVPPAWGPVVGMQGIVFCLPLWLFEQESADTIAVLEPTSANGTDSYRIRTLISKEDALLAMRIIRPVDGGLAWIAGLNDGLDPRGQNGSTAQKGNQGDSESSASARSLARARLTCADSRVAPFIIRSGNTVGMARRKKGEQPDICLPSRQGFEAVSQIQGRFLAKGPSWEFVHEGSNWTLVVHGDHREVVLRERGSREKLSYGDKIVFSGSPPFAFGR